MIKILGAKRVLVLLVLIAMNAGLGALLFMYLQPELEKSDRSLKAIRALESQTRADISNLQMEFDQLQTQQEEFDVLTDDGFFSNQSRRTAQDVFLRAEQESGVLEATVSVKPGNVIEDQEAKKADQVLLESEINIVLKSIDDRDVYIYLDRLQKNFPGHLSVEKLSMRRLANVSDTILRAIAGGQKPPLVEARIGLLWTTMVERSDVFDAPPEDTNNGGGF